VVHCEYHKTFRCTYELRGIADFLARGVQEVLRISGLDDIGNRFCSAYLISVSRKN
jgi:hypothetical protein